MPAFMAATEYVPKNQKIMEKEIKITEPEGCEIEKVEIVDVAAVITFKNKERKLPKSWEEFCKMFPVKIGKEFYFNTGSEILSEFKPGGVRDEHKDKNILPDRATAEAVLALCQLIQLRNCYNGDWVPDWTDYNQDKFTIEFHENEIFCDCVLIIATPLYFKTEELRDEFLRNFRPLIEKLKPLYGIKEGGEQ